MAVITLIHWHAGEIEERAERLRAAGHEVHAHSAEGLTPRLPPGTAAVVIDLGRLPSHGRALALALRQKQATRHLPLVLVDGAEAKVAPIRATLQDATFTSWRGIGAALKRAIAAPPLEPIVPRSTTGYSSAMPLAQKLGVKAGHRLRLIDAPPDFADALQPLPVDVKLTGRGEADVIVLFAKDIAALDRRLDAAVRALVDRGGGLWLAWPKKASGVSTDLTDAVVRERGLATGLVDTKVCAIDAIWSGLRFSRRRQT